MDKYCSVCGKKIDPNEDYYKVIAHDDYYCEEHYFIGQSIDEDKCR